MAASDHAFASTPRLRLVPVTAEDIPALVAGIGNYDVARWLGRVPYPYRPADAEAFVATNEARRGEVWFVHDADGLVGGVSIDGELGYWFARSAWGRGYATEAAAAAVAAHFGARGDEDLTAGSYPGNTASERVLTKLGFAPVGTRVIAARVLAQQIESTSWRLTRAAWQARSPGLSRVTFSATGRREGVAS